MHQIFVDFLRLCVYIYIAFQKRVSLRNLLYQVSKSILEIFYHPVSIHFQAEQNKCFF